jgi:RNA polymerase sigma-70 factor (ECF subfamily)
MSGSFSSAIELLAQARSGSREAMGQLLQSCRAYLLMVAGAELDPKLVPKGSASDIVQQTFLEAHRDFANFGGNSEAELLAWLRRLLLNNLANFTRDFRNTRKRAIDREIALDQGSVGRADRVPSPDGTPSSVLAADEQIQSLQSALQRLPAEYRTVIELRYREKRSFTEIAEQMQRSANAVRKLWQRAIERLQQEMDESS